MMRVRLFEERVRELFANARIPGFLHTSIGQEAVAVGAGALDRALSGGAIMITILGLNLLGDGVRDLLDPKIRGLASERSRAA